MKHSLRIALTALLSFVLVVGSCCLELKSDSEGVTLVSFSEQENNIELAADQLGSFNGICAQYEHSIRLLFYAGNHTQDLRYGKNSRLSKNLAQSSQLRAIADRAIRKGDLECSGRVSFYGSGDLEYAVGLAKYELTLTETDSEWIADFLIMDLYDFNQVRKESNFSNLMNNFGLYLQKNGAISNYSWQATVQIIIEK